MKRLALGLAWLVIPLAHAGPFRSATQAPHDIASLAITTGEQTLPAPRTEPEQQGFAKPRVSSDGRYVGWLALQPNCCASYPIPLTLVILGEGNALRRFEEAQPIWDWSFQRRDTAVAYRYRTTHGNSTVQYKLRRIRDSKVLETFECYSGDDEAAPADAPSVRVPAWVWSIANECPTQRGLRRSAGRPTAQALKVHVVD